MAGDRVLTVRIAGDSSSAQRAIGAVEGKAAGFGKKILKMGALFAGLSLGANIITDIKDIGIQYDQTMNTLQAASGATEKQMDKVGERARQLGADLTLPGTSAADSTAAMLELYKGGLSLTESMDAAKGSIQLATAAQVSNAEAAAIQANAMSQFSLKADKAVMVADTLANVSNAATGEITDVALALKYVGPVAASSGMSIRDTSTAIGLLAKNAIIGNTAGTSLRAAIVSMAKPTEKAANGLKKLGIEAYDSQGRFKGMRYITDKLSKAKQRLTQHEFQAAAAMAFGREPLAAMNALAKEGSKGWDKMSKAVGKQGSAAAMAKAKNKGLGGALDGLHSQLEDLYLTIWQKVSPALEKMTRGAAGKLSKFNGFVRNLGGNLKKLPEAINNFDGSKVGEKVADALGKAFDKVGSLAGSFSKKIGGMFAKIDWVGLGIELGKAAVPMLTGLAVGILNFDPMVILKGLADHWQETLFAILGIMFMPAKWAAKLAGVLRKIPFVGKFLGWLVESLSKLGTKMKGWFKKLGGLFLKGFKEAIGYTGPGLLMKLTGLYLKIGTWIVSKGKGLIKKFAQVAEDMAEGFGRWLGSHGPKQAFEALVKIRARIFSYLARAGEWLISTGSRLLGGFMRGVRNGASAVWSWFRGVGSTVKGWFSDAGSWLWNAGEKIIDGLIHGITSKFGAVRDKLGELTGKLTSWKGPPRKDATLLTGAGQLIMDGFTGGLESRFGKVKSLLTRFTGDMEGAAMRSVRKRVGGKRSRVHAKPLTGQVGNDFLRGPQPPAAPVIVYVTVEGNVIGERDFAKRVTPEIRDQLIKQFGKRNGGRIFGNAGA